MKYCKIPVAFVIAALGFAPLAKADPPEGQAPPPGGALLEFESQLVKIGEVARKSVVMITTKHSRGISGLDAAMPLGPRRAQPPFAPEFVSATYSGVVYDAAGRILTVASAVQNADEIEVTTWDGRCEKADVVGADDRTGLGIIKVSNPALKPLPLADSSELKVGSCIVVIGNPFGLRGSLSYGIVSGLARRIEGSDGSLRNMVQITAPINPGDAGGAVLDLRGRLVGLVHSTYGRAPSIESLRSMLAEGRQWIGWGIPESQMSAEGINFAMPMNDVKPIADELIKAGAVTRGWIGIRVGNAYDEAHAVKGALVVDVVPDAPAARAGIQADDIIMAVNGEAVKDVDKLVDLIARTEAGKNLQVTVSRDGRELTVPVTVAKQPPTQEAYRSLLKEVSPLLGHGTHLGVLVQDLTPEMTDYLKAPAGALVVNVLHGSAAARSGIRSQDVITAMDGAPINSAVDLRKAVSRHKSGDKIMLEVYRDGARTSVEIALTQR